MVSQEEEKILRSSIIEEINNNLKEAYSIYKYLTLDKLQNLDDVTIKPWSVDLKKDTQPRLQRYDELYQNGGYLVCEKYGIWDYNLSQATEEICKIETVYYKNQDEEYETAKLPYQKISKTQFKLADGTYKQWTPEEVQAAIDDPINNNITDIKIERKAYPDFFEQNEVAITARNNVQGLAARDLVLLITYFVTGDQGKAKDMGIALVRKYSDSYGDFAKYGDRGWVIDIENENTTTDILDKQGDPIISGISFNSMLNTTVPDTVVPNPFNPEQLVDINLVVPQSKGLTLREFLIQKFRGDIH